MPITPWPPNPSLIQGGGLSGPMLDQILRTITMNSPTYGATAAAHLPQALATVPTAAQALGAAAPGVGAAPNLGGGATVTQGGASRMLASPPGGVGATGTSGGAGASPAAMLSGSPQISPRTGGTAQGRPAPSFSAPGMLGGLAGLAGMSGPQVSSLFNAIMQAGGPGSPMGTTPELLNYDRPEFNPNTALDMHQTFTRNLMGTGSGQGAIPSMGDVLSDPATQQQIVNQMNNFPGGRAPSTGVLNRSWAGYGGAGGQQEGATEGGGTAMGGGATDSSMGGFGNR